MNAVVFAAKGTVRPAVVEPPRLLEPTDALVRVGLAGVCGTDLHLVGGEFAALEPGIVLGHEFVGEVVEVGIAVRAINTGDRVAGADFCACGLCRWCARGDHWQCEHRRFFGSGTSFGPALAGAQAELVRVPFADVTLTVVPPSCSDECAILLADNLPTGWAAIDTGHLAPGEVVAIVGGGPVGQLTALCAQVAGAAAVVVVEPSETRRRFAVEHGSLGVSPADAPRLVRDLTAGDGADLVIEAAGSAATLDAAFALVRKRGRIVSVAAHAQAQWPFPLARAFADELSFRFAIGDAIRYRATLLALMSSGVLDPGAVIGQRFALADADHAYARMGRQEILKAVIDPRR